jgi:hypothetical protein
VQIGDYVIVVLRESMDVGQLAIVRRGHGGITIDPLGEQLLAELKEREEGNHVHEPDDHRFDHHGG